MSGWDVVALVAGLTVTCLCGYVLGLNRGWEDRGRRG